MKVSGFTFVRNAVKYDYPVVESITSILPIVDEFIVSIGDSEDGTLQLIQSIQSPKIKIIESTWDMGLKEGGEVLAVETNKAKKAVAPDANWLFYLQADEVVHEKYLAVIVQAMQQYRDDFQVEGLLLKYLHFYGSYRYVGDGRDWYAKEVRIIRNNNDISSFRDAQGFRKNNRKLNVKEIDAYIFHYGYVKNPLVMQRKNREVSRFWNEESNYEGKGEEYDYSGIDTLDLYTGSAPEVMKNRVSRENWNFNYNIKKKKFKNFSQWLLYRVQEAFGWRPFEYRNYKKF